MKETKADGFVPKNRYLYEQYHGVKLDDIDDVIFTIYDYREYGKTPYENQDLEFNFHIGGFSKEQTEKALEFIKTKLK